MNNQFDKKFASNEVGSIKLLLTLATAIYAVATLLFIGQHYSIQVSYPPDVVGVEGYELRNYVPAIVLMWIYYATMAIIPVFQFKYLYNKKAIDFFHSLPIKRTALMLTKTIVGYCTMSLVFAIFFVITDGVINRDFLQSINIVLLTLLSGGLIYAFTLFIINITNNLFFMVTTAVSLLIMPFFIITGICTLINTFTIFNVYEFIISNKFVSLFNIFTLSSGSETVYYENRYYAYDNGMYGNNSVVQILLVLAITILLVFVSVKLYNLRKSYENSQFIIFKPIRIIYISLLTFTAALMLSTLFFEQSTTVIYLTTIFCIFAVSVSLDIITNFNNGKQKQELKYSIIPAVALLALLNCSANNFYGAFDTLPSGDIQSISISKDAGMSFLTYFKEQENFDTIQAVENDLIRQYYEKPVNYRNQPLYADCYVFTYTMNGGEQKSRKYSFNMLDNIDNSNKIATIPEYKENVINVLKDEKANVTIDVFPTVDTAEDDSLSSYYRLIDYEKYFQSQMEEGTKAIRIPSEVSNDALLDAIILDITNDKDFKTMGYAHPILGSIAIEINLMIPVPTGPYGTMDTLYDPTKSYVISDETYVSYVSDYEHLYLPLKPYYTNTLQAIGYKADYSVLVLEDFPEDIVTPAKYFSSPSPDGPLQEAVSLPMIIQYYYDANGDKSYEDWLFPSTTVDELLEGLKKYDLLTEYTILSTDEELKQFNDSYTLQDDRMGLAENKETINYRAFIIDNKTGELNTSTEQIITTEPNLY